MTFKSIIRGSFLAAKNFLYPFQKYSGKLSKLNSIYDQKFFDDNGNPIDLIRFKNKKLLIVNTASACGYTYQYEDLESMSLKYKSNLNVIAFPCNDFGKQEQGTNEEILDFCKVNYGVTFPVFKKTAIKHANENSIFNWLCNAGLNGWNDQKPLWNFWKFLIDENGKLVAVFPSRYKPAQKGLTKLITIK